MDKGNEIPSRSQRLMTWWYEGGQKTETLRPDNEDVRGDAVTENAHTDMPNNSSRNYVGQSFVTEDTDYNNQNPTSAGWYSNIVSRVSSIPIFNKGANDLEIDVNTRYSQLNESQIRRLESEAMQTIVRHSSTWIWFEDLTRDNQETSGWENETGILSVHGTGSLKCPLPMKSYPLSTEDPGYHVHLNDSIILPSESPLKILHEQSVLSKVGTAIKSYYNFPAEKHLYLKKNTEGLIRNEKTVIISVVGYLPEKYEKFSLEEQRSARYLCKRLALSLQHELPSEIQSLAIECPLHNKDLKVVLQECVDLLGNWNHLFKDVSSIFFVSVYHSVPLTILLAKHILQDCDGLEINPSIPVGILALESNLQGYRFWDHSSDATTSSEQEYQKVQQAREKQLFQGVSKQEKEILSKIRHYRKMDSEESRLIQLNLNWLFHNWRGFRLNMFCKLYDNFMTVSQKLAIDYQHPKIIRNVWCNGKYIGHNKRNPNQMGIPDVQTKTPKFECALSIPENRLFEVFLLSSILLALNLGHSNFVPMLKLISPFFISRSFNENTVSSNLKKQNQTELKNWLQEMDMKWRIQDKNEDLKNGLPEKVSTVHNFLEFVQYHEMRTPELMKVYSNIYDDDSVFQVFIENTIKTRSLLKEKPLTILYDHSTPRSILNTVNQYDLVWKFHEFLSEFMTLRNLPQNSVPKCLNFSITLNYSFWDQAFTDPSLFTKNCSEAKNLLGRIWASYQLWDPPTRGLKQLKNILSVLSLYNASSELLKDIERK